MFLFGAMFCMDQAMFGLPHNAVIRNVFGGAKLMIIAKTSNSKFDV